MMFFPAQFFAQVKHTKNMSEKLFFAKKQVFEQFFEQKNMSKKMSNHPFGFASENQATIHPGLRAKIRQPSIQLYIQPFSEKNQNISDHVSGTNTSSSSFNSTVPVTLAVGSP